MKQYAIISDIHGNAGALTAVIADIKAKGINKIINLGDHFFGALQPEKVAEILGENPMTSIYGNTDREILEKANKDGMQRVLADLSEESIEWLKSLPKTLSINNLIFACHGTPESDNEYLLEKVTKHGVFVYNDEDLIEKTKNIKERIILCGHSHVNRVVYLPAYLGNGEYRFAMESMTPHAKYAIITVDGDVINTEQINCNYDWNEAAKLARENGNEHVANFLIRGRMPKDLRVS